MQRPIIITGPSGAGKTTLQDILITSKDEYQRGLDYTTRPMRVGEVNGKTRYFISTDEFIALFNSKFFLEESLDYAVYNGHYYGTPTNLVSEIKPIVTVIPALGIAKKIKEIFPHVVWLHLFANRDLLIERMLSRGEHMASISYRINPDNSDPGTFESFQKADINLDTGSFTKNSMANFLINFMNQLEP